MKGVRAVDRFYCGQTQIHNTLKIRGSYDRKVANAAEKLSKIKNLTHAGAYVVAAPSAEEDNARTHA